MDDFQKRWLELARWAVDRWAAFPVGAAPRPLVLAQSVITGENGFLSGEAKDAWFDGSYEWAVDVPEGVRLRARRSADEPWAEPTKEPLTITAAGRGEQEFLTDRGPLTLAAYWLRGPCVDGALWVLDPEYEYWEPDDRAGGSRPAAAAQGQPLMRSPFQSIVLQDDGQTVSIPWIGSPAADYRVEVVETATAVSAVAFREAVPTGKAGWYTTMGHVRLITTRLREPLGDRVFVDLRGEAMRIEF